MYICSNCSQRYKELPTVNYPDGSGKWYTGNSGCWSCGSGRDAIREE